jgi:hypothetical protein
VWCCMQHRRGSQALVRKHSATSVILTDTGDGCDWIKMIWSSPSHRNNSDGRILSREQLPAAIAELVQLHNLTGLPRAICRKPWTWNSQIGGAEQITHRIY